MAIVVIGAGAVGVATAWYLRKAGHAVEIVERRPEAALETSWGNGCVIHASEVEPWSQPGMPRKIVGWLGKENAPLLLRYGAIPHMWRWGLAFARNCTPERFRANALANLDLALLSLRSVHEIAAEAGIAYHQAAKGVMKIYRDGGSLDGAEASSRALAEHGLLYERVSADRAVELEPALADTRPTLVGALYFARDEVGDCNKFTQGLAAACAARGVKCHFSTTVTGFERKGAGIGAVLTDKGRIAADQVIVAAGSFSAPMLRHLGLRMPIYPVKGISITFPREGWAGAPGMPVIDDSKLFGLVPVGDRMRISGSAEIAGYDATPAQSRADAIVANATFTFPGLAAHYRPERARIWAGLRPVTPAGTPLIGPTAIEGVWINAGHGHLGWTLACGSGRALAAMVDGGSAGLSAATLQALTSQRALR
jgi:D-amino-acid dehydrogenase